MDMWQAEPEKPKRKPKSTDNVLTRLYRTAPFAFTAPYSLEECEYLLERHSERTSGVFASRRRVLITVTRKAPDRYTFYMERDAGRNVVAKVHGTLTRIPYDALTGVGEATFVEGRGNADLSTLFFIGFWAVMWSGITLTTRIYPVMLLGIVLAGLMLWGMSNHRNQLARLPEQILLAEKQKRYAT